MAPAAPFVFLSHSGADTEAKRQLEEAPDARAAGLRVWFDKDDLRPGTPWSAQIAEAIQKATTFVVYVGSGGVMNWVEAEVDLALSRATTDKQSPLLFIPVLADKSAGSSALPPFAKRYQGVRDPLGQSEELAKLLAAVLDLGSKTAPILIDEPFVGLRAMREEESDRFFGRKAEIAELTEKFRKLRLVAVVADSGTGKSSLARAGFAPAFRGGALIDPAREEARDKIWQVVTMRPRADPAEGLRQGVEIAAQKLGRPLADVGSLRDSVSISDAGKTDFALRCGLPPDKTSTLLIVDQFEELFTATSDQDAASFAALLLALAAGPSDIRILLTVRSDYFNLASGVKDAAGRAALFERLTADNSDATLRLKAMSPGGLREAVLEPLKLAGETNETALADAVQTDISHQASDLPLLQVALRAAWMRHHPKGPPMLECYQSVGRVSGALAKEADIVLLGLPSDDRDRLESIFVRLVRLGETGGATRLGASLDDFDLPRRALLRKLGEDDYGRLVSVGATHAELTHEALITQWPWLQDMLKTNAADVRRLARLMERAKEWSAAPDERKASYLATGAERESFGELAKRRTDWFSKADRDFVANSEKAFQDDVAARIAEAEQRQRERDAEQARKLADAKKLAAAAEDLAASERRTTRRTRAGALIAFLLAIAAGAFGLYAQTERNIADERTAAAKEAAVVASQAQAGAVKARQTAELQKDRADAAAAKAVRNESVALTALANIEAAKQPVNAAKLALAAWPRDGKDTATPRLAETIDALPNLRERRVFPNARLAVFSPDGKQVLTASSDNTARLWNAASGAALVTFKGHDGRVHSAAFSPDGKQVLTASDDNTARLWNAASGAALVTFKGHDGQVFSAAFSPDGKQVLTASDDNTARLWDAASGAALVTFKGHERRVVSAAFSPDGKQVLTASDDNTARLWDAASGAALVTFKGHERRVVSAAFSPDGKQVLTASDDDTARLWDAASGAALVTFKGHGGTVVSAAFCRDGKQVLTASDDNTARLWNAASGATLVTFKGHVGYIVSAAFSQDGKQVLTASWDYTARLWNPASGAALVTFNGHDGRVESASFSQDGKQVLTASGDTTARLWDAASGAALVTLNGHDGRVFSAAFSPDGKQVLTASSDNTARLWNAASGAALVTLKGHGGAVNSAAFSPDGKQVLTASSDKTARLWNAASGTALVTFKGHDGAVVSAAFSPDGKQVLTASNDNTARLWDAASGAALVTFKGHDGEVRSAAFSPDGKQVLTASWDNTARLWDAASGAALVTFKGHDGSVVSAAFSPDGKQVLTASWDNTARLWNAASGAALVTFNGHDGRVESASFSQDGKQVLTASWDKTARLWDAASGAALVTLKGHDGGVDSAAFSPDGKRVLTASYDSTARLWTITKGNILEVACALLKLREDPVTLDGVTEYPLTFDRPICVTDPPPPDLPAEREAPAKAAR